MLNLWIWILDLEAFVAFCNGELSPSFGRLNPSICFVCKNGSLSNFVAWTMGWWLHKKPNRTMQIMQLELLNLKCNNWTTIGTFVNICDIIITTTNIERTQTWKYNTSNLQNWSSSRSRSFLLANSPERMIAFSIATRIAEETKRKFVLIWQRWVSFLSFSLALNKKMCIEYGVSFSPSFSLSLCHWTRNKIVKITAS